MGVVSCAYLIGKVSMEDVLAFIQEEYDKDAKISLKDVRAYSLDGIDAKVIYDNSDAWTMTTGFINFSHNGDSRRLSYCYSNVNTHENMSYYASLGLAGMVAAEKTHISMGCDDAGKAVVLAIVSHFGGWYDANDCDDVPYAPVSLCVDASNRDFKGGDIVIHFKNTLNKDKPAINYMYRILGIGKHTENGEQLVAYQSLNDGRVWFRPYDMFVSEVDKDKYPDTTQKYRLEKVLGKIE